MAECDILQEGIDDRGSCGIDKWQAEVTPKHHRCRTGGMLAAVSGCRVILDWREHFGGESTGEVYQLLADCMHKLSEDDAAREPAVIFMDNACALKKFAQNPRRAARTSCTTALSKLHYMIDAWHVANHHACLAGPEGPLLDPRSEINREFKGAVNTEACEQAFSFVDRLTYVAFTMGPGLFHVYNYVLMDRENGKLVRRRGLGAG